MELKSINDELQSKVVQFDNVTKSHNGDLKSVINQRNSSTKRLREIEKENAYLVSEMKVREDRMNALRNMNAQLELKINKVLKRIEDIKMYEDREAELVANNQEMMAMIDDLSSNYDLAIHENNDLIARVNVELFFN